MLDKEKMSAVLDQAEDFAILATACGKFKKTLTL